MLTRDIYFWFGVLDPDLREQCQRVVEYTPAAVLTTDKECFTMRAALFNVKTDSHRDARDWKRGLTFLTPGAEFKGMIRETVVALELWLTYIGANLCVVDPGVQVPFPSGSIAALRGREFEHFTSAWTGERTCVVHTNHQSVREEAEERMAEPEGQRGLAKRSRVEAANQRADAWKEERTQQGPEAGNGDGKGKGKVIGQVPSSAKAAKRRRSE